MKRQVYEVNEDGFLINIHVVEENKETSLITIHPPQGLYRARWTGTEWVEDMTQEEIDALNDVEILPTDADYLLDLDFRLSMNELGL